MSMADLQEMAIRAVAESAPVAAGAPNWGAAYRLCELDGHARPLREYVDAVKWAMEQKRVTLTRAAKAKAVEQLAGRLAGVSENAAYADAGVVGMDRDLVPVLHRRQRLLRAAILRVAMARTVD